MERYYEILFPLLAEAVLEHVEEASGREGEGTALPKVVSLAELLRLRERWRTYGKTVVFTNGCFDLLHPGHVHYLKEARQLGDVLIVGLNSDASVKYIKGHGRPFVPQEGRAEMLAALSCVDYVAVFDELTPEGMIAALKPDIHCKGGDYGEGSGKPMPEARLVEEYGGRVVVLAYMAGYSTTDLMRKIVGAE